MINVIRKTFFCIFFAVFSLLSLSAVQYTPIQMMVAKNTPAWEDRPRSDYNSCKIKCGQIIYGVNAAIEDILDENTIKQTFFYESLVRLSTSFTKEYCINVESLKPLKTTILFPDSWLTKSADSDRKIWVIDYYVNTMLKQDRNLLLTAEKGWIRTENVEAVLPYKWYEHFDSNEGLLIFQGVISIGSILRKNYWIINNSKFNNGYRVTVTGDSDVYEADESNGTDLTKNLRLPRPSQRKQFDLIMIPDGDYMNVYLDSTDYKIATFAKMQKDFLSQFDTMLKTGSYDISQVIWPRHEDGSCDYDVSRKKSVSLSTGVTKSVSTNLRLRSTEDTSSTVTTTMQKGTTVKIIKTGSQDTIDGITSNWVQVEVQNSAKDKDGKAIKTGTTGWCFGGYLE